MSSPIPTIICGAIPGHIAAVTEILKPEFEVIETFMSHDKVIDYLTNTLPTSSQDRKPRIIFMGGGYTHEQFLAARAVPNTDEITWFRPDFTRPGGAPRPSAPPSAEVIAERSRKVLDEHMEELSGDGLKGETVWY